MEPMTRFWNTFFEELKTQITQDGFQLRQKTGGQTERGKTQQEEEKCIATYHIDASRIFKTAHPLQRCHPNGCSLEYYTTITQTHKGKK